MIAAWIAYGLVVSALLGLAALLAEKAARWATVPTRWVWAAAISLGWLLPWLAGRSSAEPPSDGAGLQSPDLLGPAVSGPIEEFLAMPALLLERLGATWDALVLAAGNVDLVLFAAWLATTGLLLSALAITYRRLRERASSWPVRNMHGHPVRVSEDLGPAVLGVGRGQVVLPRWAVECPPGHRRLIVLHEAEHLKAGDERLLFAAVVAVTLMPWNLFAWWQLRRLRLAVELDCDRRVLRTGVRVREYASLLLEAGSRRGTSPVTAAAFVHFHSQLGRRIREMTEKRIGPRYVPAALAALGALVLLVAACEAPSPTDPAELQELTAGKQLSHVDPVDDSALQRILEEDGDVTLVVEEVDGATYVIDAVKLEEVRRKGHAELLLRKLKEHGEEGDVKLTLVHEDGTESARYGVLRRASQPEHNERVEYAPPAAEGNRLIIDKVEAAEMEMKRKKEGGSR